MEFRFQCDVKAMDLWKMAMSRTYRSWVGVVNIVFSVSVLLLTFRIWGTSGGAVRGLLVFACLLFPVIQPLAVYGRSIKQLENQPKDMELLVNAAGVRVIAGVQTQQLGWGQIRNAVKRREMIIVMSDARHGYMLSNRVLGEQKEAFFDFLCSKIKGMAA